MGSSASIRRWRNMAVYVGVSRFPRWRGVPVADGYHDMAIREGEGGGCVSTDHAKHCVGNH